MNEKLSMKTAANVSQQLRRFDRPKTRAKAPKELRVFLDDCESYLIQSVINSSIDLIDLAQWYKQR
jgi:hypothetical protein